MSNTRVKLGERALRAFATVSLILVGCGAQAIERPWERADWKGTPNLPAQAVKDGRVLYVRFDLAKLQSLSSARIEFPLPEGALIVINKTREERLKGGGYVWHGKVEGDEGSTATLSVLENTLVGDVILSNARMYRIDQVDVGVQIIFALNPAAFPPGGWPLRAVKPDDWVPQRAVSALCRQNEIDVMVIYTKAACAMSFVGKTAGCSGIAKARLMNNIQTAESQTNAIFINSLIAPRIKVVHVRSAGDYADDAESLEQDLKRLQLPEDEEKDHFNSDVSYLDDVHDWRNDHRADVVTMITKPQDAYDKPETEADESSSCGQATLMDREEDWTEKDAFTVVPVNCMLSNYSFGHEIAHLMGADHDEDSSRGSSTFPDNRGYVKLDPPNNVAPWRTVMAENINGCMEKSPELGCLRLQYFSNVNPAIKYFGDAMGSENANNSRVVSETADTVAKYRTSLSCGGT